MDMLHVTRRGDDAVGEFEIPMPVDGALERGLVYWQVLGVEDPPNRLMRNSGRRIELEDPAELLRPVVLVRQQIRDETARFAQPLGFGKIGFAASQFRLDSLPFDSLRNRIGDR